MKHEIPCHTCSFVSNRCSICGFRKPIFIETQDDKALTQEVMGEQYAQMVCCPECHFESGHSPECQTTPAKLYRKVSELLSGVYGGEYGTKNRSQLILKLQSIKSML